jgi:hypothetical protein
MNSDWSKIVNDLPKEIITAIILALLGIVAGFFASWIIKAVSSRVSSGKKSMRWFSWLFFNAVLSFAIFLSPSKADDVDAIRKSLIFLPSVISANVVIAKKSKCDSRSDLTTEEKVTQVAQGIMKTTGTILKVWGRMAEIDKEVTELRWQQEKVRKKKDALRKATWLFMFGDSQKFKDLQSEYDRYDQQVDKLWDEKRRIVKDPTAYVRSRNW